MPAFDKFFDTLLYHLKQLLFVKIIQEAMNALAYRFSSISVSVQPITASADRPKADRHWALQCIIAAPAWLCAFEVAVQQWT